MYKFTFERNKHWADGSLVAHQQPTIVAVFADCERDAKLEAVRLSIAAGYNYAWVFTLLTVEPA